MNEIDVMKAIDESFSKLDNDAQLRVLNWASQKFCNGKIDAVANQKQQPLSGSGTEKPDSYTTLKNEIPGIARIDSDGNFHLTARDIKAKNTNDAAVRITHVIIWAYERLTGDNEVSSKDIVPPLLKQWRAYTGNTRKALSNHKGILRNGSKLSLDAHSKKDAENYVDDILNNDVTGKWKP